MKTSFYLHHGNVSKHYNRKGVRTIPVFALDRKGHQTTIRQLRNGNTNHGSN